MTCTRLDPKKLAVLARQLASATNPAKAARIRERLTRGFYGTKRSEAERARKHSELSESPR